VPNSERLLRAVLDRNRVQVRRVSADEIPLVDGRCSAQGWCLVEEGKDCRPATWPWPTRPCEVLHPTNPSPKPNPNPNPNLSPNPNPNPNPNLNPNRNRNPNSSRGLNRNRIPNPNPKPNPPTRCSTRPPISRAVCMPTASSPGSRCGGCAP
jgi:hypothetical protein